MKKKVMYCLHYRFLYARAAPRMTLHHPTQPISLRLTELPIQKQPPPTPPHHYQAEQKT